MVRRSRAAYERSARYYDFIYHDLVDYEGDVEYLEAIFRKFLGRRPSTVLDLGCGTGNHDLLLARRGYEVTGLELSREQLTIARRKAKAVGLRIRFVQGDMRSFEFGRTFDAALCMFGGFGHLLDAEDVLSCLASLRRNLRPDGIFIFEFWHALGVRPSPHQTWLHKVGPDVEIVRLSESRFDGRTRLLPIEFRYFAFRDGRVLDRFDETITVRTYTVAGMRRLLRRGGFDLQGSYAATNLKKGFRPVQKDTFRIVAVARPRGRGR